MVKGKVIAPITHLGRSYAKGDVIEVDHGTAYQLVAAGVMSVETENTPAPGKPAVAPAKGKEP